MGLKPRFGLKTLFLVCTIVACTIGGVLWGRTNTLIRSGLPGTIIARDGTAFPVNRWFRLPTFNQDLFETHNPQAGDDGTYQVRRVDGWADYPTLETKWGNFKAIVETWDYGGSGPEDFRVELLVRPGKRIE